MRIGLHSGQVTAGVLRGDKGRFQLFGDTVNTCARMESTGAKHKIQISQETAALLMEAGRGSWCIPREDKIVAKGKGELETYWLKVVSGSRASKESRSSDSVTVESEEPNTQLDSKTQRLVDWNVMHLSNLLKKILAWRQATAKRSSQPNKANTYEDSMVLDEVKEIITLPGFDVKSIEYMPDESSIELDPEVVAQLRDLVAKIAKGYHDNPFHCFEHASVSERYFVRMYELLHVIMLTYIGFVLSISTYA